MVWPSAGMAELSDTARLFPVGWEEFGFCDQGRDSSFRNHLYGTFTAAKEKIVKAGRASCAAGYCPPGAPSPAGSKRASRKRQKKRGRRPRRRGSPRVEAVGQRRTQIWTESARSTTLQQITGFHVAMFDTMEALLLLLSLAM
ncbi:hypothetical protein MHU86_16484 [Fragilaria crotonensis]|nr:hypothetical protein MHU86_16484 [Fragilaria crotonensis]